MDNKINTLTDKELIAGLEHLASILAPNYSDNQSIIRLAVKRMKELTKESK